MNINCINCGHKFDLGRSYDDYDGPVRCPTCRGLLSIKTQDGNVRSVRFGLAPAAPAAETLPPAEPLPMRRTAA